MTSKKQSGRPSKRIKRREELITKATQLFNERGISGTSLGQLAEELDIARASIYHYIDNRNELVYQSYMRSCQLTADDLDNAQKAANGLQRTVEFIKHTLTPERAPTAVLTEINSLDDKIADVIRNLNTTNNLRLIEFISDGIKDGSIRDCDAVIAGQSILGMLAWAQLLPQWSSSKQLAQVRLNAQTTLIDLIINGLAYDRSSAFVCALSAYDYEDQYTNIFDPKQSAAMKFQSVLKTASKQFNRNGIEATSIDEIAAQIGVSKGVLYHYFEDKSDLITQCYERSFDLCDRFVVASTSVDGNTLDIVQTNAHLNIQAQVDNISPLMPQPGFGSLFIDTRNRLQERAKAQNHTIAQILEKGIADKVARPCHTEMVTHIIGGAIGWIPKWLPQESAYTSKELGDKISDLFRFGLKAEST